jgi:hypothetical protein
MNVLGFLHSYKARDQLNPSHDLSLVDRLTQAKQKPSRQQPGKPSNITLVFYVQLACWK